MSAGRYIIKTLGCKANLYDSQLIEAELSRRGWLPLGNDSSLVTNDQRLLCIVNSCTVTDDADRQTRKTAARMARDFPRASIVVSGCAAEIDPERLARSQGIHYVIGNRDKPRLVDLILKTLDKNIANDRREVLGEVLGVAESYAEMSSRHPEDRLWPEVVPDAAPNVSMNRTRAFLKIQEGCNSFCTYCVIPYGRGPSRSLHSGEIVNQVRRLTSEGIREVVITGTNIGDYGADWSDEHGELMLVELLRLILAETSLERLRLSSLDPTEITPKLIELMQNDPRLCPHFHVSLQSPHERVLKLMKRRYGFNEVKTCLERLALISGAFVGMDVIAGFPGETEEEFEWSYEALRSLPWTRLHVFPYSERQGTPATRLPNPVSSEERSRRARLLNQLSLERLKSSYQRILTESQRNGDVLEGILAERFQKPKDAGKWVSGYTANYLRVQVDVSEYSPGNPPKNPDVEFGNKIIAAVPTGITVDAASQEVFFTGRLAPGRISALDALAPWTH